MHHSRIAQGASGVLPAGRGERGGCKVLCHRSTVHQGSCATEIPANICPHGESEYSHMQKEVIFLNAVIQKVCMNSRDPPLRDIKTYMHTYKHKQDKTQSFPSS